MKHDCPECSRRAAEFCQIEEQRNALAARVDVLESALVDAELYLHDYCELMDSLDEDDEEVEIVEAFIDECRRGGLLKGKP